MPIYALNLTFCHFDIVFSTYLTFGYWPLIITPPYYLGYHTLVYIFKKSVQKKQLLTFLMKDLLSSQSYVLFSKYAMAFDLENQRWPPLATILNFENRTYICNGSRYRNGPFKLISALIALISYVIVILVGRTCVAEEEKMLKLILTFTKKINFVFFVPIFLQMYSTVPCSTS